MIQISQKSDILHIVNSNKNTIILDTANKAVSIDDLGVDHPGEFEKSGLLLEVKEYSDNLFYSFVIDGKNCLILLTDTFELKEEILSFFGDVDLLVLPGSQASAKVFESIEARVVVPYGDGKQTFFTHLGQHIEALDVYKMKSDLSLDSTEFVHLAD